MLTYDQIANLAPKAISSGTNLNNLTEAGDYYSASSSISSSLQNPPVTDSGFSLVVKVRGTYVDQLAQYANKVWVRGNSSGGWGEWKDIST